MVRLQGVQLPEEREEMGRVNAGLSAMTAVTLALALAIPGVHENSAAVIAAESLIAGLWALIATRLINWNTAPGWVAHASATGGLLMAAVGMWASAGHLTPGRFYLVIIVVATAYFLTPREAWWYPLGAFLIHASPLLYEPSARSGMFLTELLIVAPVYVMLSLLILRAKQQLVELRGAAHRQARQDPLTGLANRRALLEALALREPADRVGDRLGLLLIDLDDFKRANTLHGHAGGDRALRHAADILRAEVRDADLAARLGGDEFAVLVGGVDRDALAALSERVLVALRSGDEALGLAGFTLRASIGFALAPEDAPGGSELLAAADRALLAAKAAGKDAALAA